VSTAFVPNNFRESNEFETLPIGNDVESSMAIKGMPYYLSTSRSKVGDYHRYVGDSAAMFVLDGRKIASKYKVKPKQKYSSHKIMNAIQVMLRNIHPNPDKRMTPQETKTFFVSIFYEC
jgi:hypothetical protein